MGHESTFALGNFVFQLKSADANFRETVGRMLPLCPPADCRATACYIDVINLDVPFETQEHEIIDLRQEGAAIAVKCVLDRALAVHRDAAWLEAAVVSDARGNLFLLAGSSHSGKTTFALASSLTLGWKIITEDIMLIDIANGALIPFPRPLSLRDGTLERVGKAANLALDSSKALDWWYFDPECYYFCGRPLKFAVAVVMASVDAEDPGDLKVEKVASGSCLRRMLPISNLLHKPEAVDALDASLPPDACYLMEGGNLQARIKWLREMGSK